MPIQFTDEMKELINNALVSKSPCIVATASPNGQPGVGYRGSMMVFDDTHLAWWERGKRDGLENIRANHRVVVVFRNPELRKMWKISGTARVYESGPVREQVMQRVVPIEINADPERKGFAIVVEVDVITLGNNLLVQIKDGTKVPSWVTVPAPSTT